MLPPSLPGRAGHRRHGQPAMRAYADHQACRRRGGRADCNGAVRDVRRLTREDYENLLAFRASLRRFQHWSQTQARQAGLTPAQHQLLPAVKGHPGPTVVDLAGYLLLRHHSTVELIDRAEAAGLVERWGDDDDGRRTRVRLTSDGEKRLTRLAPAHLDELENLAPVLDQLVARWNSPGAAPPGRTPGRAAMCRGGAGPGVPPVSRRVPARYAAPAGHARVRSASGPRARPPRRLPARSSVFADGAGTTPGCGA